MKKRAIVIGATSGIGMEVAKQLARKGWQVGIAGRRMDRLLEIEHSTEGIVCHKQIDITKDDAPQRLEKLIAELGGMDLYFHSSGIGWQNNLLDIEKELKTIDTNGMGFVRMTDAAFNWMARQSKEGKNFRIACITSIAGTKGLGAAPAYSATKRMQSHYLECLEQLARMRHLPISITDIRPGFVKTDLIAGSGYPLQLQPEDVARLIVKSIGHGKNVATIDWRYRLLVTLWRMVPRWLWVRLPITTKQQQTSCP